MHRYLFIAIIYCSWAAFVAVRPPQIKWKILILKIQLAQNEKWNDEIDTRYRIEEEEKKCLKFEKFPNVFAFGGNACFEFPIWNSVHVESTNKMPHIAQTTIAVQHNSNWIRIMIIIIVIVVLGDETAFLAHRQPQHHAILNVNKILY